MQTTTREEQILNKTAKFAPITKDEQYLTKVIDEGGGGGGGAVIFPIILDGPIEIANASDVYEALNTNKSVYFDASFQGTNLRYTPIYWDSASLGIVGINLRAQEPDFTPVTLMFSHITSEDKFQLPSNPSN